MKKMNNMLYVLNDKTEVTTPSLIQAVRLSVSHQARLACLKVHPEIKSAGFSQLTGISASYLKEKLIDVDKNKAKALIAASNSPSDTSITTKFGKKYVEIIRTVIEKKHDLVIKEVDDTAWLDRLFGSDDMHLLRKCPCPVLLMKKKEKPKYKHIIVAVDFEDQNELEGGDKAYALNKTLVDLASSLALSEMATLHVVNAYDVLHAGFIGLWVEQPEKVEKELFDSEYKNRRYQMNTLMQGLKQSLGEETFKDLSPQTHLLQGAADTELLKFANKIDADLMVMGTVGRSGLSGVIIGNTAESILSELTCSVLAVKPEGFVSPVAV